MQRCAVFLLDLKTHQFFDVQDQANQIQSYLEAPAARRALLAQQIDVNENNPHFSVVPTVGCAICVLGRSDVLFTDFYMTMKTRE